MYLLKGYSLPILLIAYIVIFIVGCIKTTGLFKKLNKQAKTIILFTIDIVLSAGAVPIYFKIANIVITTQNYFATLMIVITCVLSMYSLYENVGIKKLVASILSLIVKLARDTSAKRADAKEKAKLENVALMAEAVKKLLFTESSKTEDTTTQVDDNVRRY